MLDYALSLLIIVCISSIIIQSYNLSFGLAGLFNLGHIVFCGVGAYTAAILNTRYGWDFLFTLPASALISGILAGGFGLLTLRLSGHYLAISTLGAAMIAQVVAQNWISLTNGPLGIRGIHEPIVLGISFGNPMSNFLLYALVAVLCQWFFWKLFQSPFGRLLRAISEDEIAAQSLGKNTFEAKTWALILSGAFAGLAGAMYTHYRVFLDPSIFMLPDIVLFILMLVVGGRGRFWGAILGVFFVTIIGEIPRFVGFPDAMIGGARNILFALILCLTMFYRPQGLFSKCCK